MVGKASLSNCRDFGGTVMATDQFIAFVNVVIWPALIAGVVWYFRKEIKSKFPVMTKASLAGFEFVAHQTPSQPTEIVTEAVTETPTSIGVRKSPPAITAPGIPPSQSGLQQFISTLTAKFPKEQLDLVMQFTRNGLLSAYQIHDPTELSEALLHYCAALTVVVSYERNFRAMFGSQVQLLMQMNTDNGLEPSAVKAIYDAAKSQYPDFYRTFAFETWIWFVRQADLVTVAANGNYALTASGRGFVKYLHDEHIPVFKVL